MTFRSSKNIEPFGQLLQRKKSGRLNFNDAIKLEVYLDFKRESKDTIVNLIKTISLSPNVRDLTVSGSPNPVFSDMLFEMLRDNKTIDKLDFDMEWVPSSSLRLLGESL